MLDRLSRQISVIAELRKGAPVAYMGPDRQLYVDPEYSQPWHPDYSQHSHARIQAMAEMARADADRQRLHPISKYHYDVLKEKGVQIHPSVDGSTPPPQPAQPTSQSVKKICPLPGITNPILLPEPIRQHSQVHPDATLSLHLI